MAVNVSRFSRNVFLLYSTLGIYQLVTLPVGSVYYLAADGEVDKLSSSAGSDPG